MTEFIANTIVIDDFDDEFILRRQNEIIAFHHLMEDHYEVVGTDVVHLFREDYARYNELE